MSVVLQVSNIHYCKLVAGVSAIAFIIGTTRRTTFATGQRDTMNHVYRHYPI